MTDGSPCAFAGCGGSIDGGYCTICGRAPLKARPPGGAAAPTAAASAPPAPVPQEQVSPVEPAVAPPGPDLAEARPAEPSPARPAPPVEPPPPVPAPLEAPRPVEPRPPVPAPAPGAVEGTEGTGVRASLPTLAAVTVWDTGPIGLGLVDIPPVPPRDPAAAVMAVAEVAEDQRYCASCGEPVGRSRHGKPGRTEGFCPQCRTHFSFTPRLVPGDVLAGRYQVGGALAHGRHGWLYLARDQGSDDRPVVLKAIRDGVAAEAAEQAVAERRFLTAVDHPGIVPVHDLVAHDGAAYLVMGYEPGQSLAAILRQRRAARHDVTLGLAVDEAAAYVLAMLGPLGHLHDQGLAFCDLKPDNVMVSGDTLRLADLVAVRHIDEPLPGPCGTVGYQAPEVPTHGPSVASDLYAAGRTLAMLVLPPRDYQGMHVHSLPDPDIEPVLAMHESLHRFLLKATAAEPAARFASAEEMAEQLRGVLHEEVSRTRGVPHPPVGRIFGPDTTATASGSGDIADGEPLGRPDWRLIPRPAVDAGDPGAAFLLDLAEMGPADAIDRITGALGRRTAPASTEVLLRLARSQLATGHPDQAATTLDSLADPGDWRLWWHRGLVCLAGARPREAVDWLDPVTTELPGEVVPKLALAVAHEMAGDLARAADLYDRASAVDPSYSAGPFGLARARLALGDREGAVEALRRVPAGSPAAAQAEVAAVRALVATAGSTGRPPAPGQLDRASALLEQLDLEPEDRSRLAVEVYRSGLRTLAERGPGGDPGGEGAAGDPGGVAVRVVDRPLVEQALRRGLEAEYRQLARHATTREERIALVDEANRVRPRTLL